MPEIIESLISEHGVFEQVFDQMERLLPKVKTPAEVKLLAAIVEGLLAKHGETEKNLAYAALDHILEEDGRLNRLHQDHREIDQHFNRVHLADSLPEAQSLLLKALMATREHFRREEEVIFPFMQSVLQPQTLQALGAARTQSLAT